MLLDTCIFVDLLRGHAASAVFVNKLKSQTALSVVSATELIAGCKGLRERRRIDQITMTSRLLAVDLEVAVLAGTYMNRFAKSHGLDPIDAIIAATATHHDLPLVTHNLKHFPMFPGLKRPY
jgi:predicted nucleic acid-binding protein